MLVVTGNLSLFGNGAKTMYSPLQATVFAGDTTLVVNSTLGWAVGDELVIAPSFSSALEYERVRITTINGNSVTIDPPIQHTHYGDTKPTISLSYGILDTRANVGHITRNIKIVSGPDSFWGYQLIVYTTAY